MARFETIPEATRLVDDDFSDAIVLNRENFAQKKSSVPFVIRNIVKQLIRADKGTLFLKFPNDLKIRIDTGKKGPNGVIILHNWKIARKVALSGSIGIAESYMDEDWNSPDVAKLFGFFIANEDVYENMVDQNPVINIIESIRHWFNENTRSGSKRNIAAHYDLGNEFYKLWLDPGMTYSSAIYEDGANSLETAQNDKYRSLAKRMNVTKNSHVLEIGCGWGGFAEFIAREVGARVTGLTISREQLKYARKRIADAGLQDRVELKFQDYRDEAGKYDHVASIEMFEAVGEKYWPTYFGKIRDCLKKGGTAGLQIITIEDAAFENYRKRPDFIQRYIFPGGMLPSPSILEDVTGRQGLKLSSERIFPQDYALTLKEWRLKFWDKWDDVRKLGFDERFKRMWEFYLYYCEAGFRSETIDVRQMFYRHN